MTTNPKVDAYVSRSQKWPRELVALRATLLQSGLAEELKWGKPCYASAGRNIAIVQEMNDLLALMFFKGALMDDPDGVLHEQGPNSRSAKRMEFRSLDEVSAAERVIAAYVNEAIRVEDAGLSAGPAPEPEFVEELRVRLDADPQLAAAFAGLTPGRRREYNLHFADAKQATTRAARVDKHIPAILAGKGLRER